MSSACRGLGTGALGDIVDSRRSMHDPATYRRCRTSGVDGDVGVGLSTVDRLESADGLRDGRATRRRSRRLKLGRRAASPSTETDISSSGRQAGCRELEPTRIAFDVLHALRTSVDRAWFHAPLRRSCEFVRTHALACTAVGQHPAISAADARRMQLPLPPAAEQRRIVEAIDSYLSRLDAAVASLERVQAKLKAYRASVLKAAVEGRLVPTEASLARAEKRDLRTGRRAARTHPEGTPPPLGGSRTRQAQGRRQDAEGRQVEGKVRGAGGPRHEHAAELAEGWCWATVDQLSRRSAG